MINRKGDGILLIKRSGAYGAKEITMYCMEKIDGEIARLFGLNPFEDPNNFYITYIYADRRATKINEKHIKGRTPEKVARLPFELPQLKRIFDSLKVHLTVKDL